MIFHGWQLGAWLEHEDGKLLEDEAGWARFSSELASLRVVEVERGYSVPDNFVEDGDVHAARPWERCRKSVRRHGAKVRDHHGGDATERACAHDTLGVHCEGEVGPGIAVDLSRESGCATSHDLGGDVRLKLGDGIGR